MLTPFFKVIQGRCGKQDGWRMDKTDVVPNCAGSYENDGDVAQLEGESVSHHADH